MTIPTPIELLTRPEAATDVIAMVRALQKLKVVVTCQGVATTAPLQVAGNNCVIPIGLTIATEEQLDPETIVWRDRALAAGGTFLPNSIQIANRLIIAIKETSFDSKLLYLLPLLGGNLGTALVPLRDYFAVGRAVNHGEGTSFAEGQFSQSSGLQNIITGPNQGSFLDLIVVPKQLGSGSDNGGLGYWERNAAGAGVASDNMFGWLCGAGEAYMLAFSGHNEFFGWGSPNGHINTSAAEGNHNYYGQRIGPADRRLYRNGTQIRSSTETTTHLRIENANTPYGMTLMGIVGYLYGYYYSGRCGVAYLTDGTLTAAEIAQLHSILNTRLIVATGR